MKMSVLATVLLLMPCLAGCLFGSTSKVSYEGKYVTEEQMAQVDVGSSEAEVVALLGHPSNKTKLAEGAYLWVWNYTRRARNASHVFLLLSSESEETREGTVSVRIEDGRVTKIWRAHA